MQWIRRNLKFIVPIGVALTAVGAYLAFGVFGVHTLFIDDKVDEAGPVFASGAGAGAVTTFDDSAATQDTSPAVPTTSVSESPVAEVADAGDATADRSDIDETATTTPTPVGSAATGPAVTEPAATAPPDTVPAEPQIVALAEGSFIPRGRYSGEGRALVLNDGSEQRFLRFEDFSTDNGPDLNVYLTTSDAEADSGTFDDEFVDLGNLKGNIGAQNYEIPPDVDLERFDTVVVWCVRFSTPFTAADLSLVG